PAACEGEEEEEEEEEEGGRLSAKQQDGRAMATLDRQIPSLDTFLCEPWSSFVSAAKLRLVDNADTSSDTSDEERYRPGEAAKLSRHDMLRRRHVPALEELCLVVCHVCSQVVTPQGILAHYGKAQRPAASWELAGMPGKHAAPGPVALVEKYQLVPAGLFKHPPHPPAPSPSTH
ncbi:Ataxin-7-like protein 1, partial [Takifugu flavidus]